MGLRRKHVQTAGLVVPDYNGQALPDPSSANFVTDLQNRMWKYVSTEGLARFSVAFVADAGSRVDLRVERYNRESGTWVQDFGTEGDEGFNDAHKRQAQALNWLIENYRGAYTGRAATIWSLLWHKRSAGEVYVVQEQTPGVGVTFTPYGFKACVRQKAANGDPGWLVKDTPSEPGRWLPDEAVTRYWTAHPDWPKLPYSSLWAGLKDLDRHKLMSRVIDRGANAALIARGLLWVPGEAMEETIAVGNQQVPKLGLDYYTAAKQTLDSANDDDVAAIVPYLIHWDSDLGDPQRIDFKLPFDKEWMATRAITVEDFARSVDLPAVTVLNGGSGGSEGGANHWSDLLVDRRTFDMTIGRDLDNLCHEDLTRYFLRPQLGAEVGPHRETLAAMLGIPEAEIKFWRVGYDPTRLIVNQDLSLKAMDAYRIGLINMKSALNRLGFRPDEKAGPADIKRLAELITRSTQTMDMTRVRRRPTEANADGKGSQVNTPITAGVPFGDVLDAGIIELLRSGQDIVWVDG